MIKHLFQMISSTPFVMVYLQRFLVIGFLSLLVGCAHHETRAQVNTARRLTTPPTPGLRDIQFDESSVVIDVRPAFLYSMSHVPRSVSLQWDDFSQAEPAQKGVLQSDLFAVTRRLARLGIGPDSRVIVLGQGLGGHGEEGRMAWMLAYLGLEKVDFTDIQALQGKLIFSNTTPDSRANGPSAEDNRTDNERDAEIAQAQARDAAPTDIKAAAIWKPNLDPTLLATRDEVLAVINKNATVQPLAFNDGAAKIYRVLDVRSEREYLGKEGFGFSHQIPNMGAININWRQFLTKQGRPNLKFRVALEKVGVLPQHRVIVIHDLGVASGEVTMALRAMGYPDVANYAGGLEDLMAAYPNAGAK